MIRPAALILTITFLSLLYVNQHANLIECSYEINNSSTNLGLLIDQNNTLRYNVSKLESPLMLDIKVQEQIEAYAHMPLDSYIIQVERPAAGEIIMTPNAFPFKIPTLILSMFSLDNEAVAKELND